jgi:hypothetical protein
LTAWWTLLAIAGVAGIIGLWVRRGAGRWLPAVTAALTFVGAPYVYHWAPLTAWHLADKFLLRRATTRQVGLLDLYLLMALASLGFAGKAESWENYFFEGVLAEKAHPLDISSEQCNTIGVTWPSSGLLHRI